MNTTTEQLNEDKYSLSGCPSNHLENKEFKAWITPEYNRPKTVLV